MSIVLLLPIGTNWTMCRDWLHTKTKTTTTRTRTTTTATTTTTRRRRIIRRKTNNNNNNNNNNNINKKHKNINNLHSYAILLYIEFLSVFVMLNVSLQLADNIPPESLFCKLKDLPHTHSCLKCIMIRPLHVEYHCNEVQSNQSLLKCYQR